MCQCSCDKQVAVSGLSLTNGRSTKCGRNHLNNLEKPNIVQITREYQSGRSLKEISAIVGLNWQKIRYHLKKAGIILRDPSESSKLAAPKIGNRHRGVKRGPMSEDQKRKISLAKTESGNGIGVDSQGYVTFTMGENQGRHLHVVIMEKHIGRRLLSGEVVHHKDRNKLNNFLGNLQLMNNSDHVRLHRSESPYRKLSKQQVAYIRSLPDSFSRKQISKELGVNPSTIWSIRTNRTHKNV
jgi:hypothetical protein